MFLGTVEERVRLLRIGIRGNQIEQLYIHKNGLRVIKNSVLKTDIWQKLPESRTCAQCQRFQGCARNIQRRGDEDVCDYMPGRFKAKVMEEIECM